MTRKKTRLKQLKERREERDKNNWKKNLYHKMNNDGTLGLKDQEKYSMMYNSLNGQKDLFASPENATRKDYKKLKIHYSNYVNRFDRLHYQGINKRNINNF